MLRTTHECEPLMFLSTGSWKTSGYFDDYPQQFFKSKKVYLDLEKHRKSINIRHFR